MALPEDFSKIFGSTATGGLTPIGDVDYAKGWEFVGSNPPTKNDFSYLQNLSDLKSQWLYNNKLQRANPFGDIKSDGTVTTALENLSLGDAEGTVGRLLKIQVFTANGQYTPTPGMKFILAHMIGGGGASGGTPATSSTQTGGSAAGNSGAYAFIKAYASDIGAGKAINIGAGGTPQVNGFGFAGGTTSIVDIAGVTGGYGSGPGSVSATTAVAQPSYDKPVINKYNKTEVLASSYGSQAWNFLQAATGSGAGWISPASPFPGGERGRGGSGIFVNASSAAQAGVAGNDGAILIMEYA